MWFSTTRIGFRTGASAAALFSLLCIFSHAQTYYKETVLHTFTGGGDGGFPFATLMMDANANLYGTTTSGGKTSARCPRGCGVVFGINSTGVETVLHSFTGGADGASPYASLIMDAKGNLYGTTEGGGSFDAGTVFKITPNGKEIVLHAFTGGSDGGAPAAGLIMDAKGNLYGTTGGGGTGYFGVVFKLHGTKETVLYNFTGGADGGNPLAGLIMDGSGNLYGTTYQGGNVDDCRGNGCGVVFRINEHHETVLHTFTGTDGANPDATLLMDATGRLCGTTLYGGAFDDGTFFELAKMGNTFVYSFSDGADGANPKSSLIVDMKGNLYGTTALGGQYGRGTAFKVHGHKETVLYGFSGENDGGVLGAGVIADPKGRLYGTTVDGGAYGFGVVFRLTR